MRLLTALALSSTLWAEPVWLGLRAGIPITGAFAAGGGYEAPAPRIIFGPLIEIRLWRGASLGGEFLLRRAEVGLSAGSPRAGIWRWEGPVTILYRFRAPARLFTRAGVSLNRVFRIQGAAECGRGPYGEQFYCLKGSPLAELRHRGTKGFVAGVGLRLRLGGLSLDPEVRLTRWFDRNFGVRDSAIRSNLNQVDFLCGVVF